MKVVMREDGRWLLGDRGATCPQCGAAAVVKYADNGQAELWHPPTDCCDYARARERRFAAMAAAAERRDEAAEAVARGWPTHGEAAA